MNTDSLSCGGYLQTRRIAQRIRLETVSQQTCISLTILRHLENEAYDRLPPEVFLRGFVQTYARYIGADVQTALQKLTQSLHAHRRNLRTGCHNHVSPNPAKPSERPFRNRLSLALLLLLCIIGTSVYLLTAYDGRNVVGENPATEAFEHEADSAPENRSDTPGNIFASAPDAAPGDISTDHDGARTPPAKPVPALRLPGLSSADAVSQAPVHTIPSDGSYKLDIQARKETWLKIIVDANAPQKYEFAPGDSLRLSALSSYNLLIGDATALALTLNGQTVTVVGRSGQTVNVMLPYR